MLQQAKSLGVNVNVFGDANPFGDPAWYQAFNSPYYNESHVKLRAVIRQLIETEIMPYVHDWDEAGEIPRDVYKKIGGIGLNLLTLGKPYFIDEYPEIFKTLPDCLSAPGSPEIDTFHELVLVDELARTGSGGIVWGLAGGLTIGLPPVQKWGSPELKKRVVADCLRGDKIICLAVTEPTAGSDVANIKCSAKDDGQGNYIVNGEKKWITNGIWADYFTVAVRTGGPGMGGISLLLIERTMPGVTTKRMKCSGVWCSGTTFITFDNVKVPKANLLGKENKGFKYIMYNFNHERFVLCTQTLRLARVCYEQSLIFANRRKTFGKKLREHGVIRWKLAEMARQLESAQSWLEHVAYQLNTMHPMEANIKCGGVTALLKAHCTKVFEYCSREACQIFGGASYTRGGVGEKVERLAREVRAMAVPGGSEEILLDLGIRQVRKLAEMAQQFVQAEQNGDNSVEKMPSNI